MMLWIVSIAVFVIFVIGTVMFLASRYRRCPSDQILVIYGRTKGGSASKCLHGGGAFVWPLIQDYQYLSLRPMGINVDLTGALSLQNIRVDVPSTFTTGVSTDPVVMTNAAQRLLGLSEGAISEMAKEIILGQLRLTIASMSIEEVNADREKFMESIRMNVTPELEKIGLSLINVNIRDITDESGYINALGQKAASEAINQAQVDVAEQDKKGAIGQAEANRDKEINVANADAAAEKGRKSAIADQRIYVQGKEAEAVDGENTAQANIADSNSRLKIREAEAEKKGRVAEAEADTKIQEAHAIAETARLTALEVIPREIEKRKIEIDAAAKAAKAELEAKGDAAAILLKYNAEAEGIKKVLEGKSQGYEALVKACGGDAKAAATMLMVEILPEIVKTQVEAIKGIQIDKVTVWDSGSGGNGEGGVPGFLKGLAQSLPQVQELCKQAGIELPAFMGKIIEDKGQIPAKTGTDE